MYDADDTLDYKGYTYTFYASGRINTQTPISAE